MMNKKTSIMEPYKNSSGDSKVTAYRLKPEGITVQFTGGAVYEYDYRHTGEKHVENMKQLALAGEGLGTYISVITKYGYAKQLK